ncbi:MAG TPA: cytochrome c-type biogenesis protein CcmH [Acidobacteriaceae bacterium]
MKLQIELQQKRRRRILQTLMVCVFAITMLGASAPKHDSFNTVGHQLMCQCGCGQILLECNHVGCPVSGPMIDELKAQFAAGGSETQVLNWFVNKYGPIVLAAPIRGGFDTMAWVVPFAVLVLATVGVAFLIRYWKRRYLALPSAGLDSTALELPDPIRDRIRRETGVE